MSPSSHKILVADDTPAATRSLRDFLEHEGFQVVSAASGEEALAVLPQLRPDVILLDLTLAGMSSLEVCRQIRTAAATAHVAIIIVSSQAEEMDKVAGLEAGANDYMTKPVGMRELVARINALLRSGASVHRWTVIRGGQIEVDLDRHTASVAGRPVRLTSKEFDLLGELMQANGRVLRREYLLDRIWGYRRQTEIQSRTVDVHIASLRRKLEPEGHRILTVRGAGYRFDLPPDALRLVDSDLDQVGS